MSAFNIGHKHIDYLVTAAIRYDLYWGPEGHKVIYPNEVGRMLIEENQNSVNHRYRTDDRPAPYTFREVLEIEPVQIIKAINCLEYQSCEHPGWDKSEAWYFCRALKSIAISLLPGYQEAKWEVL